jgi:virginiamycin B lyase
MCRLRRSAPLLPAIVGFVAVVLACAPAAGSVPPSTPSPAAAPAASGPPLLSGSHPVPPDPQIDGSSAPPTSALGSPGVRSVREFDVRLGTHPHDVFPAVDGGVWYTGQRVSTLGYLDPASGAIEEIPLGNGAAPHGVIVGPDGAPWITDGGLNAIVRVDPVTRRVDTWPLPADRPDANLNTATFDGKGTLWFTGQNGIYGSLDPATGEMRVYDDPDGRGPYGIATTPEGEVWYSSLAGSHLGEVDRATGSVTLAEPPTDGAGARRVWSDSRGRLWVSEWNAGQVAVHDPADGSWREWPLPGGGPMAYAVFVDENDIVWLTDFGSNAIVRFDPATEQFESIPLELPEAAVRQLAGRPGEIWGAESGVDKLVVVTGG